MKILTLIGVASLVVLCFGCNQSPVVNRQPESSEPLSSVVAPTPDATPTAFTVPSNMKGVIAGKYEIAMSLSRNGEKMSGSYFYTTRNAPISLTGTIDETGNIVLDEFTGSKQTGKFEGKMISANEMSGLWSQPNGEKPMPFVLKESSEYIRAATPRLVPSSTLASNSNISASPNGSAFINPLTNSQVEAAISKLVSNLRLGGSIAVEGVRELPQQNAAVAELRFREFKYGHNFERQPVSISQYEKGAGRKTGSYWEDTYNETMKPQAATYTGGGTAILTRYTDGRWVLKEVRWDGGFLAWSGIVEVK